MVFAVAAALLIGFAASTLAYRYRILHLPGEPIVVRMDRELHLTPAQRSQIRDIMQDTRFKIMQYQRDFRRQRRDAFLQALQQIRGTLTPDQQQLFDRDFLPYGARRDSQKEQERGGRPVPPTP
jgi:hypothetical protein